jgi:hypothetical protein
MNELTRGEAYFSAVYELRERNIGVAAEGVDETPVLRVSGAVLELEAQEVAQVGRGSAAQFDCQSGAEVRFGRRAGVSKR